MLHVTEQAVDALVELLETRRAAGKAVRVLATDSGGFSMRLDAPRMEDDMVCRERRPVLVADAEVSELLRQRTLDVRDGGDGQSRFLLRRAARNPDTESKGEEKRVANLRLSPVISPVSYNDGMGMEATAPMRRPSSVRPSRTASMCCAPTSAPAG